MNHHRHHTGDGSGRPRDIAVTEARPATPVTHSLPPSGSSITSADPRPRIWVALWNATTALIALVAGIAPHVLHHIGLFAGAFVVTGAAGNLLFGALGMALSIPLLRRLYHRFGTWKAPTIAVGIFAIMFLISALIIGPAINGDEPTAQIPVAELSPGAHAGHHG